MNVELFEIGGCVRDEILGVKSHDIDYTCVADSFEDMVAFIEANNLKIVVSTPEHATIRAVAPKEGFRGHRGGLDFVWAREDGPYSDGRRPDWTRPADLLTDQRRRDFTVNSIAKAEDGSLIDPFGGVDDLNRNLLRAVGNAEERFREDALRALRAIRFRITKDLYFHEDIIAALRSDWLPPLLATVSAERRREELDKCFKADTLATLDWLNTLPYAFSKAVFTDGLRLKPTMEA